MRILIFGINYAPELTGIGKYTGEMASWLAKNGHQVNVITSMPYYPEWKTHTGYQRKWWLTETINDVLVFRCPLYVPKSITSVKRIIHEFSFFLSSLPVWLSRFFGKKYDVVICISPPFHLGILPLLYSKIRNAKFVTHIQDLQIDAAKEMGMIKNEVFLNLMFRAESKILHKCDMVSTISEGMFRRVLKKGVKIEKTAVFPNWVDENAVVPLPPSESLRRDFGIKDSTKVIMYSGNLGEKQGLEIIFEVARFFDEADEDIIFLIVGNGGAKNKLESIAKDYSIKNVAFFDLQPYSKLSALLATADLHLVLQKKSASDLVMPSKLTAILSAGGCALVTAIQGTTLCDVIVENQMGIIIEPESVEALKTGIVKALNTDLEIIRKNARSYAEKYLTKEEILLSFEQELSKLVEVQSTVLYDSDL